MFVVAHCFNDHVAPFQGVSGPVEAWVELLEPGVPQNDLISS